VPSSLNHNYTQSDRNASEQRRRHRNIITNSTYQPTTFPTWPRTYQLDNIAITQCLTSGLHLLYPLPNDVLCAPLLIEIRPPKRPSTTQHRPAPPRQIRLMHRTGGRGKPRTRLRYCGPLFYLHLSSLKMTPCLFLGNSARNIA
jgi:hypothetical protein